MGSRPTGPPTSSRSDRRESPRRRHGRRFGDRSRGGLLVMSICIGLSYTTTWAGSSISSSGAPRNPGMWLQRSRAWARSNAARTLPTGPAQAPSCTSSGSVGSAAEGRAAAAHPATTRAASSARPMTFTSNQSAFANVMRLQAWADQHWASTESRKTRISPAVERTSTAPSDGSATFENT